MGKSALLIIACFLAAILALTGCQQTTQSSTTAQAFLGGDSGLDISYITGSPPDTVFDQGKFPFAVNLQVQNKGEWDIADPANAVITISGIDPASFNSPALTGNIGQILAGRKKGAAGSAEIAGGIAQVPFSGFNYEGAVAGDVQFTIRSTVCYAYGSKAQTKVCIKSDLLSMDETTCKVTEAKTADNSAAPIHVTDVKEAAMAKDKLSLQFTIKHVGTGDVFMPGSSCSNSFEDQDIVYVKLNTGVTPAAQCSGLQDQSGKQITASEGYVKLFKSDKGGFERIITCTQQIVNPGNFEKLVEFELTYDYSQFIDKKIVVSHVG